MVLHLGHYAGDSCEEVLRQQANNAAAIGSPDKYSPGREIVPFERIYKGPPFLGAGNGAHTGTDSDRHSAWIYVGF